MRWRRRPLVPTMVGLVVVAAAVAGCGGGSRDRMDADTAKFTWGERSATVPLTECGREGDVVVLAGTAHGLVVQAGADLSEGGAARTGVTGDMGGDDGIWGAFGADLDQGAAGEITEVRAEGDRLVIEGRWARLDGDLRPEAGQPLLDGELVARCPETESDDDSA